MRSRLNIAPPPPLHRRSATLLLLFLPPLTSILILTGCAVLQEPRPAPAPKNSHAAAPFPRVEIFRGLGGFMLGLNEFQQKLDAQQIHSTAWQVTEARTVADQIIQRRRRGDDRPIILIAYALGGSAVKRVAKILQKENIPIDAIILIDPSFFEPVPASVNHASVIYHPAPLQKWNSIMRGHPVKTESPQTTTIELINLSTLPGATKALHRSTHLTITSSAFVQDLLTAKILRAIQRHHHLPAARSVRAQSSPMHRNGALPAVHLRTHSFSCPERHSIVLQLRALRAIVVSPTRTTTGRLPAIRPPANNSFLHFLQLFSPRTTRTFRTCRAHPISGLD